MVGRVVKVVVVVGGGCVGCWVVGGGACVESFTLRLVISMVAQCTEVCPMVEALCPYV